MQGVWRLASRAALECVPLKCFSTRNLLYNQNIHPPTTHKPSTSHPIIETIHRMDSPLLTSPSTTTHDWKNNSANENKMEKSMKTRATDGYGLDAARNGLIFLAKGEMTLFRCWTYLARLLELKKWDEITHSGDKIINLYLLGFHGQELELFVSRLTEQNKWQEAALILGVETRKWNQVLELLMQGDEQTRLVASTLAGLSFPLNHSRKPNLPSKELSQIVGMMGNQTEDLPLSLRFAYALDTNQLDSCNWEVETAKAIENGDLDCLPLIGTTNDQWKRLVKAFMAKTGDLQTAALISAILSFSKNEEPEYLPEYRNLLDAWGLPLLRCNLDVERAAMARNLSLPIPILPGIILKCTFCNASLKSSFASCQACKKPLPRCALCEISVMQPSKDVGWVVWCNHCHHGGHSKHLRMWFTEAQECPVAGCTCNCSTL